MVMAERQPLRDASQLFLSRLNVTQPYAENLARRLGAKIPQLPDNECLPVGESFAAGYKLAGRIGQEPSTGEVYALVKGQRLVHLVYIRHDKDDPAAAPAWKLVADTLKVEPPADLPPGAAMSGRVVSGGVLNGRAISKPPPWPYPAEAKNLLVQGTVSVQIFVDETGKVVHAKAISGHRMLHAASETAAKRAKFSPTTLCGKPVRVTGVITYNFVLQR
ncbi:MAG: energy transducer TonB [Acidobacteria bacterium]|nr:energy transducer TonB [Acidobacteriota bacterium]MCA1619832.1 energy transducer TonB [Acidobacteriota bacterium]